MKNIVELETDDGRILSFEAEDVMDDGTGYEPASDIETPLRRRFDEAFDDLRALAAGLTAKLDTPDLRPDCIEIEVGVKMTAKAGVVFASAGGDATLSVKLSWNRPPKTCEQTG